MNAAGMSAVNLLLMGIAGMDAFILKKRIPKINQRGIKMKFLGHKQPEKSDEEIKKDLAKKREEMLERSIRLRHLIESPSPGWNDFTALLDEYIQACKKRKAVTALDTADEKTIYQLKLLDHEIYILSWVKQMPGQFINKADEVIKKANEEEQ